jgi:hypothetical protein
LLAWKKPEAETVDIVALNTAAASFRESSRLIALEICGAPPSAHMATQAP